MHEKEVLRVRNHWAKIGEGSYPKEYETGNDLAFKSVMVEEVNELAFPSKGCKGHVHKEYADPMGMRSNGSKSFLMAR